MLKYLSTVVILFTLTCLVGCVAFRSPNYSAGRSSFIEGNYYQAFKQLYPAAQGGNPDAQYAVGYMYYYGLGTSQDRQTAIAWMQRAANQGQAQAINAVESILNTGYTSSTGYTGGLSKPKLLNTEQRYVPANENRRHDVGDAVDVPDESSSQRKASWPPPRSQQSSLQSPKSNHAVTTTKQQQIEQASMSPQQPSTA